MACSNKLVNPVQKTSVIDRRDCDAINKIYKAFIQIIVTRQREAGGRRAAAARRAGG